MPARWDDWVHAIVSTYGTWLPGDPRGFRDHDHRVHSSGHYKRRPPPGEHAGLYRYAKQRVDPEVVLAPVLRPLIAEAFASKLHKMSIPLRILAIGRVHGHALARVGAGNAKPLIGRAKQCASHAIRDKLPGSIWSQGCHVVRIESDSHYRWVVKYIENHQGEGAAIWVHPRWRGASDPDLRQASGPASR